MKKILSTVLAAAIAVSSAVLVPVVTVSAAAGSWNDSDIMPLLDSLGIMQGDGNGNYNLDAYVTREEMAKIAVNSSSFKDQTAVGMKVSPFNDIDPHRWSAAYILNGTQNGLFNGYLDGSFKPYDMVKYEEAVTMMLKVLGYTDENFGISYPYGQVNYAKNIDLTENVNSDYGCWMTRSQIARMVYNALNANTKQGTKLISVFDADFVEDAIIISVSNENKANTNSGKYTLYDGFNQDYIGLQGDMVIRNQKDLLCFVPSEAPMDKYAIYSLLSNAVVGYKNGSMSQISVDSSTTCYNGTQASTYGAVKANMQMGDILRVKYDSNGRVDYLIYEEGTVEGPIKVTGSDMVSNYIKNESTQVMRDGNKVTAAAVMANDVIYYSEEMNMVLAYSTKVSGIYESASPSRDQPNQVTISGKTYNVEGVQAFNDLSSSGSLKYGDTITVVLGRAGDIAGVVTASAQTTDTKYGYVIGSGKKNFTNNDGTTYSSYYITLVGADGATYEYPTTYDSSSYICAIVKATFNNGETKITKVNSSGSITGRVDSDKMTIGNYKVAAECKILDCLGTLGTLYLTGEDPLYKSVYLQRLDGMTLNSNDIRYFSKNARNEITEIFLKDVTGDMYDYGIVTSITKNKVYTFDVDGVLYTASDVVDSPKVNTPAKGYFVGNSLTLKGSLKSYGGTATNLTGSTIDINGVTYQLSDKVVVYENKNYSSFAKISINEAINGNYSYSAYYDETEAKGGRIRVIVVKEK